MTFPRILGIICQALILGTLLFLALIKLSAIVTGAHIFQYQGF